MISRPPELPLSVSRRASTPPRLRGVLQLHVLGAIAEFERERIRERVIAGLTRVKAKGQRLGRPEKISLRASSRL
jgi:DNA invertase Pin-like site-specific DNA recombinase